MRIEVDPDRCEGQAVCVGLAPKVFELNDDDEIVRVIVDERALKAVEKCPMAALKAVE